MPQGLFGAHFGHEVTWCPLGPYPCIWYVGAHNISTQAAMSCVAHGLPCVAHSSLFPALTALLADGYAAGWCHLGPCIRIWSFGAHHTSTQGYNLFNTWSLNCRSLLTTPGPHCFAYRWIRN